MRLSKFAATVALGISALGLSACATGFPAQVSRFQAMPAAQGQSFYVVPLQASDIGGLEFSRYAGLVSQAMQAQGYVPATSVDQATMLVRLGYGVDQGTQQVERRPFGYRDPFYDPFMAGYGFGYRRPYYSRFGYGGYGGLGYSPFY